MSDCRFCNGEVIKPGSVGPGLPTISMAVDQLCAAFGYRPSNKDKEKCHLGIQLQHGNRLCWDSSAREYATLDVEIQFCPFCGSKLEYKP